MREIKYQAFNEIDKIMVEWGTLKASPILFMNIVNRRVKHYILRQYTGLKDMNGNEIYDGDIVCVAGAGNFKVEWDECYAGWIFDNTKEAYDYQEVIDGIGSIVGNIYENP